MLDLFCDAGSRTVFLSNDIDGNVVFGSDVDAKVAGMLRAGVESSRSVLPVTALCDSFGRIIYYSEGYDTSLGQQLVKLLPLLSSNQ